VIAPVRVLCIGGSTGPGRARSPAVRVWCARRAGRRRRGDLILSRDLMFPIYDTETPERDPPPPSASWPPYARPTR